MRKIFQFDGNDNGILSIGECNEYETVAICIKDRNGNEAQMRLSRDSFRDLCSLDIRWRYSPETEEAWRLLIQAPKKEEQEAEVISEPPF